MSMLIPAMVCVITFEVISRYIFDRPTVWAYDISIFIFGYVGLLAGAYSLKHGMHVKVDVVYGMLSKRWRAGLDVVTGLLCFFFLILVIAMDWEPAVRAIRNNQTTSSNWGPPIGHFKLMIPLGASLFLLQSVADWIRNLYLFITDREFPS